MNTNIFKKLLTLALTFSTLAATPTPASAQRRAGNTPGQRQSPARTAPEAGTDGAACGAWRGKITYYKSATTSGRASVPFYGTDINTSSSKVSGEITLDAAGRARGQMTVESKQKTETVGSKKDCCWANLAGCQKEVVTKWNYTSETAAAGAGDGEASVEVRVAGSKYKLDFAFPQARGRETTRHSKTMSGSCAEEMNRTEGLDLPEQERVFEQVRAQAEGSVDPQNPNVLEGSFRPDKDSTVTWNLVRVAGGGRECEGDLMLSGLKLEHHVFPDKSAWEEVGAHTVDGNVVRLTATVSNGARTPKGGTVTFRERYSGEVLGTQGVSVPAGGEARAEVMWDTSGYAWSDLGEKMPGREVVALLDNGDKAGAEVKVYPKPVILVHGLWSSAEAWGEYPGYLREAHSFAWRGYAVGADPRSGRMNTGAGFLSSEPTNSIFQNAQELGKQIKAAQVEMNAWHVDLVAHSMGGLISRFFIHSFMPTDSPDGRPYVTHLVMLGTPNEGSPCADLMDSYFDFLEKPVEAVRQLKPEVVAEFNNRITNRKGVKFSILSGFLAPRTCQSAEVGDGVVSLSSALWKVADRGFAPRVHTDLTGKEDFEGFVKPRLALGPKKAKQQQSAGAEGDEAAPPFGRPGARPVELASLRPAAPGLFAQAAQAKPRVVAARAIRVRPESKLEVPVSFPKGARAGVSFIAPKGVTVTLVSETDEESRTLEAEQSGGLFRTIYVEGGAGEWKLRFENEGPREEAALFTAWADPNPLALVVLDAQAEEGTRVYVRARLTEAGAPAPGAVVTGSLRSEAGESSGLRLFDDGQHDDEEAGDGVYGGRTADGVKPDDYFVEVRTGATVAPAFVIFRRSGGTDFVSRESLMRQRNYRAILSLCLLAGLLWQAVPAGARQADGVPVRIEDAGGQNLQQLMRQARGAELDALLEKVFGPEAAAAAAGELAGGSEELLRAVAEGAGRRAGESLEAQIKGRGEKPGAGPAAAPGPGTNGAPTRKPSRRPGAVRKRAAAPDASGDLFKLDWRQLAFGFRPPPQESKPQIEMTETDKEIKATGETKKGFETKEAKGTRTQKAETRYTKDGKTFGVEIKSTQVVEAVSKADGKSFRQELSMVWGAEVAACPDADGVTTGTGKAHVVSKTVYSEGGAPVVMTSEFDLRATLTGHVNDEAALTHYDLQLDAHTTNSGYEEALRREVVKEIKIKDGRYGLHYDIPGNTIEWSDGKYGGQRTPAKMGKATARKLTPMSDAEATTVGSAVGPMVPSIWNSANEMYRSAERSWQNYGCVEVVCRAAKLKLKAGEEVAVAAETVHLHDGARVNARLNAEAYQAQAAPETQPARPSATFDVTQEGDERATFYVYSVSKRGIGRGEVEFQLEKEGEETAAGVWTGTVTAERKRREEREKRSGANLAENGGYVETSALVQLKLTGRLDRSVEATNAHLAEASGRQEQVDYEYDRYKVDEGYCGPNAVPYRGPKEITRTSTTAADIDKETRVFVEIGTTGGTLTFSLPEVSGRTVHAYVHKSPCAEHDRANTNEAVDEDVAMNSPSFSVSFPVDPTQKTVRGSVTVREEDGSTTTYTWELTRN